MKPKKEQNVTFFREQLPTLLADPKLVDKFVVIHDQQIKNAFDTFEAALSFAVANYLNDEFVVQRVVNETKQINFYASAS